MKKSKYMFHVDYIAESLIMPFDREFVESEKNKKNYIEFEDLKEYVKKYPGCYSLALDEESKPLAEKVAKTFNLKML